MRRIRSVFPGLATLMFVSMAASDPYPAGCVDCHTETDDGDLRVNVLLSAQGHTRINEGGDEVPGGCNYCHAADDEGTATPMRWLMHQIHYEVPEENLFVSEYQSDCRHCHSMNESEGLVRVKSGKANWLVEETEPATD